MTVNETKYYTCFFQNLWLCRSLPASEEPTSSGSIEHYSSYKGLKMRDYHLLTTNEPLYGVVIVKMEAEIRVCKWHVALNTGKFLENYTQGYSRRWHSSVLCCSES
jgi:hypothetical protein